MSQMIMIEPPEKTYQKILFRNKTAVNTRFSLKNIKDFISNLRNKTETDISNYICSLSDSSMESLEKTLSYVPDRIIPSIVLLSLKAEKKRRAEIRATIEAENRTISEWVSIKKQLLGQVTTTSSRTTLLEEARLYKQCLADIMAIRPVQDYSVKGFYGAIPRSVLSVINRLLDWDKFSYEKMLAVAVAGAAPDTNAILRWYIIQASKSLFGYDLAACIIIQVIKRLLDISFLPIPSTTTVYLVFLWSGMLAELSTANRDIWALDDLIGLALAFIALLQQVLNRETPLAFIKMLYTAPIMTEDLINQIPPDIKRILEKEYKIKFDARTYIETLTNISTNWNHALGDLTDIENLSIGKSLDMLYTYRIGITYLNFINTGKGLNIDSFSAYWSDYGPLPKNKKQIEDMLDLFRGDDEKYNKRIREIYDQHLSRLSSSSDYDSIMEECGGIYDEISRLNVSYYPSTYDLSNTFKIQRKFDHPLIYMIAGKIKSTLSNNSSVQARTQDTIASDIFRAIDYYIRHHV